MLLITVVCGFASVNAQEQSRLMISAGQFRNITLGEGMRVVLVSSESLQNEIKGDMSFFEKLNVSISEGSLHIKPARKLGDGETVFIVVNRLESLTLGQRTQVITEGILRASEIKVYVNERSIARLMTTGEVNAYSLDDNDFSITKTPSKPLATAKGF